MAEDEDFIQAVDDARVREENLEKAQKGKEEKKKTQQNNR
jgi:hypothetical protein